MLLTLALIAVPFILIPGYDTRLPKEVLAIGFSMAIALWHIHKYGLKPVSSKLILAFPAYCFLSSLFIPQFDITIGGMQVNGLWNGKALFEAMVYLLLFMTISSRDFSDEELSWISGVVSWVGTVQAAYVVLQFFGIDQFNFVKPYELIGSPEAVRIVGTFGNATLVGAFLAICLPHAIKKRNWYGILLIPIAILMTQSLMSIGCAVVAIAFYALRELKVACAVVIGMILLVGLFTFRDHDSGRKEHWKAVYTDLSTPPIEGKRSAPMLTGYGLGAFKYTFTARHESGWLQAHNEYLEILYGLGWVGLFLFLGCCYYIFSNLFLFDKAVSASLVAVFINAFGSFPWHLGAHAFYTVLFIGIIMSQRRCYGKRHQEERRD